MKSDSLVSVRRIRQPILSNADIQTAFDGITYQKGAAVLTLVKRSPCPDCSAKALIKSLAVALPYWCLLI
jgi:hypothetical protein